jgi:hypothetical protein
MIKNMLKDIHKLCRIYISKEGFLENEMDSKKLEAEIVSYKAATGLSWFLKFLSYIFSGGIARRKRALAYCKLSEIIKLVDEKNITENQNIEFDAIQQLSIALGNFLNLIGWIPELYKKFFDIQVRLISFLEIQPNELHFSNKEVSSDIEYVEEKTMVINQQFDETKKIILSNENNLTTVRQLSDDQQQDMLKLQEGSANLCRGMADVSNKISSLENSIQEKVRKAADAERARRSNLVTQNVSEARRGVPFFAVIKTDETGDKLLVEGGVQTQKNHKKSADGAFFKQENTVVYNTEDKEVGEWSADANAKKENVTTPS